MKTMERNGTFPKNRLPPAPSETVPNGKNEAPAPSETVSNGGKAEPPVNKNLLPAPSETVSNGKKPEAPPPTDAGRDSDGRFAAGNKFAAGNPFARRMARLRSRFLEAVTEDDLHTVARKLVDMAKGGDLAAAKLLLAYAIGQPTDPVNPDRMDLDELALVKELPNAKKFYLMLFEKFTSAEAARLSRTNLDSFVHDRITDMIDGAARPNRR
jgi:hypothetical protein